MPIYTLNNSTITESSTYDLSNYDQKIDLLTTLFDNTTNQIKPRPLRDAILSIWANTAFKETKVGDMTYIGIDTLDPRTTGDRKDAKYKILLGKRSYTPNGESYSESNDILTEDLLESDTDIFFFNTKDDLGDQNTTKLSFLASTDSELHINAPYLSTQYVSGIESLTFNIVNKGVINLVSENNTYINNLGFPKASDSNSLDLDNKLLVYRDGNFMWEDFTLFLDNVGMTGSELNIYGDVNINDYSLDFTDSRKLPIDFGGLNQGETFGSNSITEMLKRMIYPNQAPTGSLVLLPPFDNGIAEVGTFPNPMIEYTIVKKTSPTITTIIGVASAIVISPINTSTQNYKIIVSDSNQENTDDVSIKGVYPIFYGIDTITSITNSNLSFLDKLVEDKSNKNINIIGEGNIYFLYPVEYDELVDITDSDDNSIDYESEIISYSSPLGYWASKDYYIYYSTNSYSLETPTEFKFKFS
jgi:hypothetical protein